MTFVQALYSMDEEIDTLDFLIAQNTEPGTVRTLTDMRKALIYMKQILINQANEMQKEGA